MKPAKNSNNQGSKTKDLNENSTPKIQSYFKSTPKLFVIEDKSMKNCNTSKDFYVEGLKRKLQNINAECILESESGPIGDESYQQEDGACALDQKECEDVPSKKQKIQINCEDNDSKSSSECTGCKDWEQKYKDLKKVHLKLALRFSELEMKQNDLLKEVTNTNRQCVDDIVASIGDTFTQSEIKYLDNMPLEGAKDSTFILQCLEFAYKTNPMVLQNKTLKGKPEWLQITEEGDQIHYAEKEPLTPEKVERIRELFHKRISKIQIGSVAYGERIKRTKVNRLIATGIKNIVKKQK